MSAALPRSESLAQARVLAMWRAQPGALMLLGRASGPLPKAGSARVATALGALGVFRAEFWPLPNEAGQAFLAAIRLPDRADPADSAELIVRGARNGDRDFRLPLVPPSIEPAFGKQVAAMAGTHGAKVARFMFDVMRSDDGSDMRQPNAVLNAFLTHAARADGCVELILHVPEKCVLLQGWGTRPTEPVELFLPGCNLPRYPAQSGDFPRSDIATPATGSVLALPAEAAAAMTGLEKVFLLTGDDLLCRQVVEQQVLDGDTSIGQIRHLLPRLSCSAPMLSLLRATLQPQYQGRDTLSACGRPVRAALDMAVATESGGAYLSGWLFDPAGHVAELHLCADVFAARLDETWVRVPREDVSAAFRTDPTFPPPLGHDSGFAVATQAAPAPGQSTHLRFTFADGDLAFLPVRFADPGPPSVRNALLASVDLHKPSGVPIVEQHLAPFIARLPPAPPAPGTVLLRGPLDRARAIVVPLPTAALPRSFVSSFLLDPPGADEQIVFVCGPEWDHARREALVELVRFYQLPASIIAVPHTPQPAGAVREAATASEADSFLLASAAVVGCASGWRDALHRAARGEAACPTVLFEDRSLRFAGPTNIAFDDRAPFVGIHAPLAGACASVAKSGDPAPTDAGTFACCLIRRPALPALARAAQFITGPGQEAAFFLALRDAGLTGIWVPSVQVSAPEDDPALTKPASPLVDGWILRQTWEGSAQCAS
jgi:hypothetical protein